MQFQAKRHFIYTEKEMSRGKVCHVQISVMVSRSMHQIWLNFKVWPLGLDYAIALNIS